MDLRPYQADDAAGCLSVFDSNSPEYFHVGERAEFEAFLSEPAGPFSVLEHDGAIVGCGGYAYEGPDLASLCWLMVRRDLQGNGLGRLLVFSAMRKLASEGDPAILRLHTPSRTAGFFEKQGFRTLAAQTDRVEMVKKLKVCT